MEKFSLEMRSWAGHYYDPDHPAFKLPQKYADMVRQL